MSLLAVLNYCINAVLYVKFVIQLTRYTKEVRFVKLIINMTQASVNLGNLYFVFEGNSCEFSTEIKFGSIPKKAAKNIRWTFRVIHRKSTDNAMVKKEKDKQKNKIIHDTTKETKD